VAASGGEADRWVWLHVALARHLQGTPSHLARLDFTLACCERPLRPESLARLDAFAAGCLDGSQMVMDLLGRQPNLARALTVLAELAAGRLTTTAGMTPTAASLAGRLGEGMLPHSAEALWERLLRELARGNPLCRNDQREEWATTVRLRDSLPAACPEAWRDRVRAALQERIRRLRDAGAA
jgi:uncharacterized protein YjeT (DUF2065 family)